MGYQIWLFLHIQSQRAIGIMFGFALAYLAIGSFAAIRVVVSRAHFRTWLVALNLAMLILTAGSVVVTVWLLGFVLAHLAKAVR